MLMMVWYGIWNGIPLDISYVQAPTITQRMNIFFEFLNIFFNKVSRSTFKSLGLFTIRVNVLIWFYFILVNFGRGIDLEIEWEINTIWTFFPLVLRMIMVRLFRIQKLTDWIYRTLNKVKKIIVHWIIQNYAFMHFNPHIFWKKNIFRYNYWFCVASLT